MSHISKNIFIATFHIVLLMGFTTCKKKTIDDPISANSLVDFELRLDNLRKQSNIPGMVGGIVKNEQVFWIKNYGYSDIERKIPVTDSTIFHLASLTKTFASTLIVQFEKENKINLNDPVA